MTCTAYRQGVPLVVDHGGAVEGDKVRVEQVEELKHTPLESADILACGGHQGGRGNGAQLTG